MSQIRFEQKPEVTRSPCHDSTCEKRIWAAGVAGSAWPLSPAPFVSWKLRRVLVTWRNASPDAKRVPCCVRAFRQQMSLKTKGDRGLSNNRSETNLTGWWFEPLWKIWKSIGMMRFPIYGKIKNVPNHQPDINETPVIVSVVFSAQSSFIRWLTRPELRSPPSVHHWIVI